MKNEPSAKPNIPPVPSPTPTPTGGVNHASDGLAIAAMITGIVSVLAGWIPFFGLLVGATAVTLAIIAMKKVQNKGMSVTGLVTGVVGVLWGLILIVMMIASIALFGGAAAVISNALDEQSKEAQVQVDAKKDFAKDEVAKFGQFEVKAVSVQRNYVPENEFQQAGDGKELIVVNVEVKNIGDSTSFGSYELDMDINGVTTDQTYLAVEPEFKGGTLSKNATAKGNIVFEIEKDATDLKLRYETRVDDYKNGSREYLVYTLAV